jgi:hypothetical protein
MRLASSIEQHPRSITAIVAYNTAMSTLFRTLRNLRRVGIKVSVSRAYVEDLVLIAIVLQDFAHQMAVRSQSYPLATTKNED